MKIRCIATDLDGSLLQSDSTISATEKAAVRRAVDNGISVLLSSGRMMQSMRPFAEELELNVPMISYNGAIIQESISRKILYHEPVPMNLAVDIFRFFNDRKVHLNVYLNDRLYMAELTEWGKFYEKAASVTAYPVGAAKLEELLSTEPSHKMLAIAEADVLDDLQEEMRREYGDSIQYIKSKTRYLEILAPGVSKGNALKTLTESWGLQREEVMAIGDAPNDLSMITWAGVGVAMGNSFDEVKEQADLVVADNNHNGFTEAVEWALASK